MNHQPQGTRFVRHAQIASVLLAGILFVPVLCAQTTAPVLKNRYLFIFDTSAAMKKYLPTTTASVTKLFMSGMNEQLKRGDSIGVWTFAEDLHTRQIPLQSWNPDNAAKVASNITTFVSHQRYAKNAKFDAVMPSLNTVVRDSDRLTALIVCDGSGEIHGTPYDAVINQYFKQHKGKWLNSQLPIVIVFRSQFGRYAGYVVNLSTKPIKFPAFPPLPQPAPPPQRPSRKTNPPPPPPRPPVTTPPLIIVGTKVGTNLPPHAPVNPPPPVPVNPSPDIQSNPPPPTAKPLEPTNVASIPTNIPSVPEDTAGQTNVIVTIPENPTPSGTGALVTAVILLILACALMILILYRMRSAR